MLTTDSPAIPLARLVPGTTMNGKPVYEIQTKTVLNPTSKFKDKLLCDGPTFSAGTACAYSCSYCFVESMMYKNAAVREVLSASGLAFEDVVLRRADALDALRAQLYLANGKPRFSDPNDNRVIYGSPLVDIAANMTLVRETIAICELILSATNWQIRLLSKSTFLPQIAKALAKHRKRLIFGVSTGTLNDKIAKAFEQGSPLVSKRIASLRWLQKHGFRTYGMICPSLPEPNYDKFCANMLEALQVDKLEHVWGEIINLRGDSFTRTIESLRGAGLKQVANRVAKVHLNAEAWENYARSTFLAYTKVVPADKLRFLQYVDKASIDWWWEQRSKGAVLLGPLAEHRLEQEALSAANPKP